MSGPISPAVLAHVFSETDVLSLPCWARGLRVSWKNHVAWRGKEICAGSREIRSRVGLEAMSPTSPSTLFVPQFPPQGHSRLRVWMGQTELLLGSPFPLMSYRAIDKPGPLAPVRGQVFTSLQRNREREHKDNRMSFFLK